MAHWVEFLSGLAVVLFVFADVFSTVLVPRAAHGLRFGPIFARLLSPIWRAASNRFPTPRLRQHARGSFAPFLLVLSLITWVGALAMGFALMLVSQPQNVSLEHYGFAEALFQGALALSTLGMIHADVTGSARTVVAIAGLSGFVVVSLVVAFLLSIQSALHRRETLVLTLAARAGRPPSAIRVLEAMSGIADEALANLFGDWERWTAEVTQSHLSYPVLCRFRSLDEDMEWLSCLGAMLDAAALMVASDPADYPRATNAARFLLSTAGRACHELGRLLRVEKPTELPQRAIAVAKEALVRAGYVKQLDPMFGDRLSTAREPYEHGLTLIAQRLDIDWTDTLGG